MMTIADCLQFSYDRSTWVLHLLTDDLTPAEWLHRPVPGANHVAWIIGHLIVVERNALKALGLPLPALPSDDFAARHNKGGSPGDDAGYGDPTHLLALWDEQRRAIVAALPTLPATAYDTPMDHPVFKSAGHLLALMPNHTMLHVGQISTVRRSLGKPAAF